MNIKELTEKALVNTHMTHVPFNVVEPLCTAINDLNKEMEILFEIIEKQQHAIGIITEIEKTR